MNFKDLAKFADWMVQNFLGTRGNLWMVDNSPKNFRNLFDVEVFRI